VIGGCLTRPQCLTTVGTGLHNGFYPQIFYWSIWQKTTADLTVAYGKGQR